MNETEKTDFFSSDENLESMVNDKRTKISEIKANYQRMQNDLRNLEIESGAEKINLDKMYKDSMKAAVNASVNETYENGSLISKIMPYAIKLETKLGIPVSSIYIQREIKKAQNKSEKTNELIKDSEMEMQRLEDKVAKLKSMIEACSNAAFANVKLYEGLQETKKEYWEEINKLKAQEIETGTSNARQIAYLNQEIKKINNDSLELLKSKNEFKSKFGDIESKLNLYQNTLNNEESKYNNLSENLEIFREDINAGKFVYDLQKQGKSLKSIFNQIDENNKSGDIMRQFSRTLGPELVNIQKTINYLNSKKRSRNEDNEWNNEYQTLTNQGKMERKISLDERMMKYVTIN